MKKWRFVFLSMIMIVMMSGCNHKSNAELVDVEQFRCQDSIETVFDVLGEGEFEEQETPFGTNYYYTYEDVNLFGYSGELVFGIKDDKRTINDFYCKLNLSNKEYEELLSYLSQKYGSYEVNDKWSYCTWEVSVEDGRIGYEDAEIGFDTISLQDNGNKKYTLFFKDEWSSINDEVYFEALEESQNPESDRETIGSKDYEYDGVTMHLIFSKDDDGLFYFSITLDVEEKWKGAGIYTYVASLVKILNEQLEDKGISSTVIMLCDEAVISNIMSYTTDGELVDVATWLIEGYQDENFDADECEKLWEQMEDDIYYYLLGDEYLKYKNN